VRKNEFNLAVGERDKVIAIAIEKLIGSARSLLAAESHDVCLFLSHCVGLHASEYIPAI
jgi:hypothetical protein